MVCENASALKEFTLAAPAEDFLNLQTSHNQCFSMSRHVYISFPFISLSRKVTVHAFATVFLSSRPLIDEEPQSPEMLNSHIPRSRLQTKTLPLVSTQSMAGDGY
jgi:hypothetical protein